MSDPVTRLETAATELRTAREAVQEIGKSELEQLATAHDRFLQLLDEYEEPASGSGRETFQSYVEFEGELETFMNSLPENLLKREDFEAAETVLDRRRLNEQDFDRARDEIASVTELVGRLEDYSDAVNRYREARKSVKVSLRERRGELKTLEETLAFAEVDPTASVDPLREPIDTYNEAVGEAFADFLSTKSARRVMEWLGATQQYPLVKTANPPKSLIDFLETSPAGEQPISTVLEWANYTHSKLSHYVDDPERFQSRVGANRSLLERIDAEPLQIDWPPPKKEELRYRTRELIAVVSRFAPADVCARLQTVRDLSYRSDYSELRSRARARHELTEQDLRELSSGEVSDKYEQLKAEIDRLETALESHPDR